MQLIKGKVGYNPPVAYSVTGEAEEKRNQLALKSRAISTVVTPEQNEHAGEVSRAIRKYVAGVETIRKELTKPLLDGQRLLKALSDAHCEPLVEELERVEQLATNYIMAERRRVEAAEKLRQQQFQQAENERIEAEKKATAAAQRMSTEKGMAQAEKAEVKAQAAAERVQTIIAQPQAEVQRSKGQTVKKLLRWEVTDIRALAAARPDLVRMEPNGAGIQSTCIPEMPNLPPGLKLWWEDKAVFANR